MSAKPSKKPGRTGTHSDERNSRSDWVRAGLALLMKGGIEAVRVEPLAVHLGVTKGSFYWHFKDRAELHAAMLEQWSTTTTGDIMELVDRQTLDPRHRLHLLISRTTADPGVARLETAIRSWATSDHKAKKAVASVDGRRIDYVASLLRDSGVNTAAAERRARIIYLVLIGSFFAATTTDALPEAALWAEVERLLTMP